MLRELDGELEMKRFSSSTISVFMRLHRDADEGGNVKGMKEKKKKTENGSCVFIKVFHYKTRTKAVSAKHNKCSHH